jgi:hypothetical protein
MTSRAPIVGLHAHRTPHESESPPQQAMSGSPHSKAVTSTVGAHLVRLGAFHWCYDARGLDVVWEHFRYCRHLSRREEFCFLHYPIMAVKATT